MQITKDISGQAGKEEIVKWRMENGCTQKKTWYAAHLQTKLALKNQVYNKLFSILFSLNV